MNMNDFTIPAPRRGAFLMLTAYAPPCFRPSPEAIDVLAEDLKDLQDELFENAQPDDINFAVAELLRRIGGFANVPSYVKCLLAGRKS